MNYWWDLPPAVGRSHLASLPADLHARVLRVRGWRGLKLSQQVELIGKSRITVKALVAESHAQPLEDWEEARALYRRIGRCDPLLPFVGELLRGARLPGLARDELKAWTSERLKVVDISRM